MNSVPSGLAEAVLLDALEHRQGHFQVKSVEPLQSVARAVENCIDGREGLRHLFDRSAVFGDQLG